jgi:6-phosphogluconate dehydrogenase
MTQPKTSSSCDIGIVGLGVMGRHFLWNIADHGFSVAGLDQDPQKAATLQDASKPWGILGTTSLQTFVHSLRKPRCVMLLVPAGAPVDAVLRDLLPHLEEGDLVLDGGNSHFKDTDRRSEMLSGKGISFLGVGISGGEEGARYGPCLMPGGPRSVYPRIQPILEAVAAQVDGRPCVAYLGPGSSGHFVKMVHNGIEYALMQLIAESYDLLKRGLGFNNDEIAELYRDWNKGELNGYLVEITSRILVQPDGTTGERLIDHIRDAARQKGTGAWTSQSALDLQVPATLIDTAVAMRDLSALEKERFRAVPLLQGPIPKWDGNRTEAVTQVRRALYAATIIAYAQGFALLARASSQYGYGLQLEDVARIWRGGCIIRAHLLTDLQEAFRREPSLPNPLLDPSLAAKVSDASNDLRTVVSQAARQGLPIPGLMAALSFLDSYRNERLPTHLIQAQRDYFGSHTYERIDAEGVFHTRWNLAIQTDV